MTHPLPKLELRFSAAVLCAALVSLGSMPVAADAPVPAPPPPDDLGFPVAPVPPQPPPAIPSIDYGVHLRTGATIQNRNDSARLGGVTPTLDTDLYIFGQIHPMVGYMFTVGGTITAAPGATSAVNISLIDAIARFEPMPELKLWVGRLIVQADRYSPSGPWGMDEWYYPGFFPGVRAPALPKAGPFGRDYGANLWGSLLGQRLKYNVGVFELQDTALSPLWSGRVQLDLWDPEPHFFQRTTYYGAKDILAIGLGAQFQREGSVEVLPPPAAGAPAAAAAAPRRDDHLMGTADVLFEKRLPGVGTVSAEGAMSLYSGAFRAYDRSFLLGAGFLFPTTFGIGKLRPSLRYQQASLSAPGAGQAILLDVQLSYVITGWYARVALGYRRSQLDLGAGSVAGNALFVGVTVADP